MNEKSCHTCGTINGVECGVINCMYNTNGKKCTADRIQVRNESAMKKAETFCSTFAVKPNYPL